MCSFNVYWIFQVFNVCWIFQVFIYQWLFTTTFAVVAIICFMIGMNMWWVYLVPQNSPCGITLTLGNKVVLYSINFYKHIFLWKVPHCPLKYALQLVNYQCSLKHSLPLSLSSSPPPRSHLPLCPNPSLYPYAAFHSQWPTYRHFTYYLKNN